MKPGDIVTVSKGAAYWLLCDPPEGGLFSDSEILFGDGDMGVVLGFSELPGYDGEKMVKILTSRGIGNACQPWLEVVE
jgi:hypothetical protein